MKSINTKCIEKRVAKTDFEDCKDYIEETSLVSVHVQVRTVSRATAIIAR